MIILILLIGMFIVVLINVAIKIWSYNRKIQKELNAKQMTESIQNVLKEDDYKIHKTKPLTEEQIADIHARGKITPAEKVKELEDLGMCIGDYAGSAAWRCRKFGNCHDCLVDYANTQDEHTSFFDEIKIICK